MINTTTNLEQLIIASPQLQPIDIAINYGLLFLFLLIFLLIFVCMMSCCVSCRCLGTDERQIMKHTFFERRFDLVDYNSIYTSDKEKIISTLTGVNKDCDKYLGIDKNIVSKLNKKSKNQRWCCRSTRNNNSNKDISEPLIVIDPSREEKKIDISSEQSVINSIESFSNSNSNQKKRIYFHYSFDNMNVKDSDGAETVLGNITDNSKNVFRDLEAFVETILKVADPEIVTILLKISSPGGYAYKFELAHTHLMRLRAAGFQLIGLVDDICASGGYMLACACNYIVSAEYAKIGSIGVVTSIFNYHDLIKKIGLVEKTITTGAYKRPFPTGEPLEPIHVERVNESVQESLQVFKSIVQNSRKLSEEEMQDILSAKVWHGCDALNKKLIDRVCSSNEYLSELAKNENCHQIFLICRKPIDENLSLRSLIKSSIKYAATSIVTDLSNLVFKNQINQYHRLETSCG
jgi:signal peptide peptidase SppA